MRLQASFPRAQDGLPWLEALEGQRVDSLQFTITSYDVDFLSPLHFCSLDEWCGEPLELC